MLWSGTEMGVLITIVVHWSGAVVLGSSELRPVNVAHIVLLRLASFVEKLTEMEWFPANI
jgi:hypothetical protein